MNRPTFGQLRNSTLAQAIGLCDGNITEIARYVNEAQERLLYDPLAPDEGWVWGHVRMAFTVSTASPYIIAPREIARIIAMTVCKQPVKIKNGFYEFLDYGIGLQPTGCDDPADACGQFLRAYERETTPTLADLYDTPQTIRIYFSDARDVGKQVLIQGKDQNDKVVLSTDSQTGLPIAGEWVTCASPFADTVNTFSVITGIQKDATYGDITLMQVDSLGNELPLSSLEPSETTALYRKYFINGLPANCCSSTNGSVQVEAQCKLDLVPVASDPDWLIIPSIPALIEEVQCIRKSRMDDAPAQQMAEMHHARALKLLFGHHDHILGKQTASISVPLFGSDKVRSSFS